MSAPDEAEEWGRRMIQFEEEPDYLATEREWRVFVSTKLRDKWAGKFRATPKQIAAMEMARRRIIERLQARPEWAPPMFYRYRDLPTGRFLSREEFLARVKRLIPRFPR